MGIDNGLFVLQTCGCIPLCSAIALESESRVCSMRVREGRWEREREVSRRIGLGTLNRPNSTVDSSCESGINKYDFVSVSAMFHHEYVN